MHWETDSEGKAYSHIGTANRNLGLYDKALESHNKALVIAQELGDRVGEGAAYGGLGTVFENLGQLDKALMECLGKHLTISKEVGDIAGEAITQMYTHAHNDSLGASYAPLSS